MRLILRNASTCRSGAAGEGPPRLGRRQELIDAALQRLRHALALVVGPEAILATRDVCGLSPAETPGGHPVGGRGAGGRGPRQEVPLQEPAPRSTIATPVTG